MPSCSGASAERLRVGQTLKRVASSAGSTESRPTREMLGVSVSRKYQLLRFSDCEHTRDTVTLALAQTQTHSALIP